MSFRPKAGHTYRVNISYRSRMTCEITCLDATTPTELRSCDARFSSKAMGKKNAALAGKSVRRVPLTAHLEKLGYSIGSTDACDDCLLLTPKANGRASRCRYCKAK